MLMPPPLGPQMPLVDGHMGATWLTLTCSAGNVAGELYSVELMYTETIVKGIVPTFRT